MSDEKKACELAVKLLSYRPRSEKELYSRICARFGRETAVFTIGLLKEKRLVDDFNFACWWVSQRQSFKPMGRLRLVRELLQYGVARDVITETLGECTEEDELRQAIELAHKKLPQLRGAQPGLKLAGFLSRRGFAPEIIRTVCRRLTQDNHDLP